MARESSQFGVSRRSILKTAAGFGSAASLTALATRRARAAAVDIGPWVGAVTHESAWIKCRLSEAGAQARVIVSTREDLTQAVQTPFETARDENDQIVGFRLTGLLAGTAYHYGIETDMGVDQTRKGRFATFARPGTPASFKFVSSSCCRDGGANAAIFEDIVKLNPSLFLHLGDFHYADIATNDRERFRSAFRETLLAPRQAALYRQTPLAYTWDDHDFGPNNSNSRSPGRLASRLTYQEYHCHYPLAAGAGDVPIHQSFSFGRVKFILTDLRSERVPGETMMGKRQLDWFASQLQEAKQSHPLVFWASSVPYIGEGGDDWRGFQAERRMIANLAKEIDLSGLTILSGDAHMLAADDGRNADFADGGGRHPIRVFQTAALGSSASQKGGPYSEGAYPGSGQFGLFDVQDLGDKIKVTFSGRKGAAQIVNMNFEVPAAAPDPMPQNDRSIEVTRRDSGSATKPLQVNLSPGQQMKTTPPGGSARFEGLSRQETHEINFEETP